MKKTLIVSLLAILLAIPASATQNESPAEVTKAKAEKLLLQWTDALLSLRIEEGDNCGNFDCPACGKVHGRTIDMVWPLTWLWQKTGQEKYLEAARDVIDWGEANLQQSDGSYKNDFENNWRGITEFSQISLGKTLLRFSDVLPAEVAEHWRDLFLRQTEWIYDWANKPGDGPNVNYKAARPLCMELAYRITGDAKFHECAVRMAKVLTVQFAPDGLFFGESHPSTFLSPKGLRGVDMGYNVEESLPLLMEYAEMTGDGEFMKMLLGTARTHLDFILPDGGLDNSFGTRSNKWSYWGSRTSDGILNMLSVLARNGCPEALRTADLTLDLYAKCTDSSGLLTGGLYYEEAGEPACIHHSFTHIKTLPDWIEADFSTIGTDTPLLSETAFGVRHYDSRDVYIIGTKNWRATVNNADNWFNRESQTTAGGSLSLLYHHKAGLVLAGSMMEYQTDEGRNMQWQKNDTLTRSFTPRLENGNAASTYEKDAVVTVHGNRRSARVSVEGMLTTPKGKKTEPFRIEYALRGNSLKISVSGNGNFILPVICTQHDAILTSGTKAITINREGSSIAIRSNKDISMAKTPRPGSLAFTPVAGLMGAYLTVPSDGKTTRISIRIK